MMKRLFKKILFMNLFIFLLEIYETNNLMAYEKSFLKQSEDIFLNHDLMRRLLKNDEIQDISNVFSGSLDFNGSDKVSYGTNDFWDLSKNFRIFPSSIKSPSYSNNDFSLSSVLSSCTYYTSQVAVDIVTIPLGVILDYLYNYNNKEEDYYYSCFEHLYYTFDSSKSPNTNDIINFYKYILQKNDKGSFFKSTKGEPYLGMYKEIRNFSYNLLDKYRLKLDSNMYKSTDSKRKNVFIFISNSPLIPVKIFLQTLQSQSNMIRSRKIKYSIDNSIFVDIPFSLELLNKKLNLTEEDIFAHFSKYIDPSIIEGNNLIFVDLAWDGTNIASFVRNFRRYLANLGIKEHVLYTDIHTFFPKNLRSNFLNELSTYSNVDVVYSNQYFSYLMKNLFFMMYDNTLLSFVDPKRFDYIPSKGNGIVKWDQGNGKFAFFLPLDRYALSFSLGNYYNVIRGDLRTRNTKFALHTEGYHMPYPDFIPSTYSNKRIMLPSDIYKSVSDIRKGRFRTQYSGANIVYEHSGDWLKTVGTNKKVFTEMFEDFDLIEYFMNEIDKDPAFTRGYLCSRLFIK